VKERCEWPRCRKAPTMEYIGKSLCNEHWDRVSYTDSFSREEAEALAMLNLKRLRGGDVVSLEAVDA
jgi:hypothetical protein